MTLLVLGRSGQVATELARALPGTPCLGRDSVDLDRPEALEAALAPRLDGVTAVINAAAWTAVDAAEEQRDAAYRLNAESPGVLARLCADRGIPLLHVSTDYVFDGSGTAPRSEDAPTGPLNAYGASKLAGEEAIRAAGGRHGILRTSWVVSAHGANFVKTMLRVGQGRDSLDVVADQVGGPTPAAAIAEALVTMARAMKDADAPSGTWHFSGTPDVSWADFAREILSQAGLATQVRDIGTSDWPTPAARPLNSRLDCTAIGRDFGIARPDWHSGLAAILTDLKAM